MPKIELINPITYPGWDDLILSTKDYSFFHSSAWAKVLSESYGYNPLYFAILNSNNLLALTPCMEVRSTLTGKRGVSLPFSDFCDPILTENAQFKSIFSYIVSYGNKHGWRYIELRSARGFAQPIVPSATFYRHTLNISDTEENIFSKFRKGTKSSIRKSSREAIEGNVCTSLEAINEFYRLNCIIRKKHGLPPQPKYFFENIYNHVISKNLGCIVLASHNRRIIAGAVFFHLGKRAIYKYAASDKDHFHTGSNNLVLWEAIRFYSENGFQTLCLGRTESENEGLRRFKRGWGADETKLCYCRYYLGKKTLMENIAENRLQRVILSKLPAIVLRGVGLLLYKDMG
jgi:hypothetical protein